MVEREEMGLALGDEPSEMDSSLRNSGPLECRCSDLRVYLLGARHNLSLFRTQRIDPKSCENSKIPSETCEEFLSFLCSPTLSRCHSFSRFGAVPTPTTWHQTIQSFPPALPLQVVMIQPQRHLQLNSPAHVQL